MRTLPVLSMIGVLGVVAVSRDAAAIPLPDQSVASCNDACLSITNGGTTSGASAINGQGSRSNGYGVVGSGLYGVVGYGGYYGLYGQAGASNGSGVHGEGFSYGPGVSGNSASSLAGVYGSGGVGVRGDGATTGVQGFSSNTSGQAVYGLAQASSGTTYGVLGVSNSTGGAAAGVYGSGNTGGAFSGIASGIYGTCTTSGCNALYIAGKAVITGALTCGSGCNSDRRLKQNIETLPGAVNTLLKLRGVTFEWKQPEEHENRTGTQMGLIAQEVQKVFPQWVRETEKGVLNVDVDPRAMAALTVESIRALQAQNDNLRERVKSLEAGQRPMMSGFGEGWIGAGLMVIAGAIVFTRRKAAGPRLV